MAVTVIGGDAESFPIEATSALVEVKDSWSGAYTFRPDIQLVEATYTAPGFELSRAQVTREYGTVKEDYESSFAVRASEDLVGHWLRVRLVGETGAAGTAWEGQISAEQRDLGGASTARTGRQTWVAYGPEFHLSKQAVTGSVWLVDGSEKTLGWSPDFNARDQTSMLVGNRSSTTSGGTYLFGGEDEWTRLQALQYVLTRYASTSSGPTWTVGGQTGLLELATDTVPLSRVSNCLEAVELLVSRRHGMGWKVRPTGSGFEVYVFALLGATKGFRGVTLPRNPMTVEVQAGEDLRLRPQLVRAAEQRYSKVRVVGERAVVCCSLRYDDGSLTKKWATAAETSYKAGTGTSADEAHLHDRARHADSLDAVYRVFGAPDGWDHNGGSAAPRLGNDGTLLGDGGDAQNTVRRTLSWLPLRAGFDYTTDPPTEDNPSGYEAEFMGAQAWLYDEAQSRYVPAPDAEVSVSVPTHDWGVYLGANPAHLLAGGSWSGANDTVHEPRFTLAKTIATVAFQGDQVLALEQELVGGDGTVMEIQVPGAELWYLAPATVVGVDKTGALITSPSSPVELRNDSDRLALVMAGAIARYLEERARAAVRVEGLVALTDLVGQVLSVIEDQGDTSNVEAPITSVTWVVGPGGGATTFRTGYAAHVPGLAPLEPGMSRTMSASNQVTLAPRQVQSFAGSSSSGSPSQQPMGDFARLLRSRRIQRANSVAARIDRGELDTRVAAQRRRIGDVAGGL